MIDAGGQLLGSKTTKDQGVDGPESGTGHHCHHRLWNHGHVDEHAVTLLDAMLGQHSCQQLHLDNVINHIFIFKALLLL